MKPICSHFLSCAANGFLESSPGKQPDSRRGAAAAMTIVMVKRMGFFGNALRSVNPQSFRRETRQNSDHDDRKERREVYVNSRRQAAVEKVALYLRLPR